MYVGVSRGEVSEHHLSFQREKQKTRERREGRNKEGKGDLKGRREVKIGIFSLCVFMFFLSFNLK